MSHLAILVSYLISIFHTQALVRLENLALRHQIAVYQQSISTDKKFEARFYAPPEAATSRKTPD